MINVYSRKYEIRMSVNLETLQHMITVELSSCICFILWLLRFLGTFISFFVVVYCLICVCYTGFHGLHWKCCNLECNVVILWHWAEWKSKKGPWCGTDVPIVVMYHNPYTYTSANSEYKWPIVLFTVYYNHTITYKAFQGFWFNVALKRKPPGLRTQTGTPNWAPMINSNPDLKWFNEKFKSHSCFGLYHGSTCLTCSTNNNYTITHCLMHLLHYNY